MSFGNNIWGNSGNSNSGTNKNGTFTIPCNFRKKVTFWSDTHFLGVSNLFEGDITTINANIINSHYYGNSQLTTSTKYPTSKISSIFRDQIEADNEELFIGNYECTISGEPEGVAWTTAPCYINLSKNGSTSHIHFNTKKIRNTTDTSYFDVTRGFDVFPDNTITKATLFAGDLAPGGGTTSVVNTINIGTVNSTIWMIGSVVMNIISSASLYIRSTTANTFPFLSNWTANGTLNFADNASGNKTISIGNATSTTTFNGGAVSCGALSATGIVTCNEIKSTSNTASSFLFLNNWSSAGSLGIATNGSGNKAITLGNATSTVQVLGNMFTSSEFVTNNLSVGGTTTISGNTAISGTLNTGATVITGNTTISGALTASNLSLSGNTINASVGTSVNFSKDIVGTVGNAGIYIDNYKSGTNGTVTIQSSNASPVISTSTFGNLKILGGWEGSNLYALAAATSKKILRMTSFYNDTNCSMNYRNFQPGVYAMSTYSLTANNFLLPLYYSCTDVANLYMAISASLTTNQNIASLNGAWGCTANVFSGKGFLSFGGTPTIKAFMVSPGYGIRAWDAINYAGGGGTLLCDFFNGDINNGVTPGRPWIVCTGATANSDATNPVLSFEIYYGKNTTTALTQSTIVDDTFH